MLFKSRVNKTATVYNGIAETLSRGNGSSVLSNIINATTSTVPAFVTLVQAAMSSNMTNSQKPETTMTSPRTRSKLWPLRPKWEARFPRPPRRRRTGCYSHCKSVFHAHWVLVDLRRLAVAPPRHHQVVRETERDALVRDRLPQVRVEEPGVALRTELLLLTARALEGLSQQLLAGSSGKVSPRVPAQLDAALHARAAPRCGAHGGGGGRKEAGTS